MAKQLSKKFIGDDQVDGDKLKLLVGQTLRKDDGAGGSVDVIAVLESATSQVQSNLDVETVARNAATDALQTQINTVQTDLGTEISTRAAAIGQVYTDFNANDALLTTIINDEVARASGQEAAIRGEFAAADTGLQTQITDNLNGLSSDIVAVEDALAQEILDRQDGDVSLQQQIDALSGSSGTSLAALEASLTQEIADRIADVNAEEARAIAAEGVLTAAISQEVSDRQSAVSGVQSQINAIMQGSSSSLDSFIEVVQAFEAADSNLNNAITSLSTGLSADIDAEESARIAGDNALDARLDVLESVTWKKQKFAMSNGQISISLAHLPVAGSVSMFVDQVPMHESIDSGATDDFSISGTSVSFINDFSATGNKKMQANDTVYVKYQYKA